MSDEPVPPAEPTEVEPQPEPEVVLEPSTPEQVEKAEQLIRQAKLATMRKQSTVARKLLDEAIEAAPRSAPVLEAVADDMMERKQLKVAMETYKAALDLDPTNVTIERKYAEAVLAVKGFGDPMSMLEGGGHGPSAEHYGKGSTAAIVNVFLPGAGHFMIGETGKGIAFLALSILGYTLAAVLPNGVRNLLIMLAGKNTEINGLAVAFLLLGIVTHMFAFFDAVVYAKRYKPRKVVRPMPLIDKDYEI
jgi:tetratricopeptide (TPR) repeat protein